MQEVEKRANRAAATRGNDTAIVIDASKKNGVWMHSAH